MKEPARVFQLKNVDIRANCLQHITYLEPDPDEPFQVMITSGVDVRSLKQNRLYWKHIGEINKFGLGDLHYYLKRKFLHPIYLAGETKANIQYQLNYKALMIIKKNNIDIDYEALHAKMLTTTDATVKQMMEYITAYWPFINEKGCYLTDPETYLQEAA